MVGRFSLISAAVFAGVVVAGGLISSGAVNPVDALSSVTSDKNPAPQGVQDQTLLSDTSSAPTSGKERGRHEEEHDEHDEREDD